MFSLALTCCDAAQAKVGNRIRNRLAAVSESVYGLLVQNWCLKWVKTRPWWPAVCAFDIMNKVRLLDTSIYYRMSQPCSACSNVTVYLVGEVANDVESYVFSSVFGACVLCFLGFFFLGGGSVSLFFILWWLFTVWTAWTGMLDTSVCYFMRQPCSARSNVTVNLGRRYLATLKAVCWRGGV